MCLIFLSLIFFITCIKSITSYYIELCDKFDIVHNFDNCQTGAPVEECPNQGTWEDVSFTCTDPGSDIDDGSYCEYGKTNHDTCCMMREIHYIDFWFEIVGGFIWRVNFFNYFIQGHSDNPFKGRIVINDIDFNDLYTVPYDNLTHVGIALDYEYTCEVFLSFYINGVLLINVTAEDILDISPFDTRNIMEMTSASSNHLHYLAAHHEIPTDDRIMELYNLGANRSIDTRICYNCTKPEVDIVIADILVLEGEIEECNDNLNQCNASLIECEEHLNGTLEDCLDIIIYLESNLTRCQNYTEYLEGELEECNNLTIQCNDTLNETQEDLTQCNDILNECEDSLSQCDDSLEECDECDDSETIVILIELRRNLSLCINESQHLEMLLMEAYINTQSWIIAFIVTGSIFLISILGYISWWIILPCLIGGGKKKRRRKRREKRRKYKEEEEMEMSLFK